MRSFNNLFDPIPSFSFRVMEMNSLFENQFPHSLHPITGISGMARAQIDPVHEFKDEGCYTVTLSAYTNYDPTHKSARRF